MKKILLLLLLSPIISFSQKKSLDHSVYDSWQSIGEKLISANGKFVAYTINVQEGDNKLVIQNTNGTVLQEVERGYNITISDDDKFIVFKIKPTYKQTRDAKIAKKKADDMPKDSLGIYDIDNNKLEKIARVRSYKMPEKAGGWLAYLMEKPLPETKDSKEPDSAATKKNLDKRIEKLQKELDSLQQKNSELLANGFAAIAPKKDTTAKPKKEDDIEEGTELVLRNLSDGKEQRIKLVQEYLFSKKGNAFVVETTKKNNSKIKSAVVIYNLFKQNYPRFLNKQDTIVQDFFDAKQFCFRENGCSCAFLVTFDTAKIEQRNYQLLTLEMRSFANDSTFHRQCIWIVDTIRNESLGIQKNWRINENANVFISERWDKIFFGTSPKLPIKDTTLPEFERVNVDVWNYKDDDVMTAQLKNVDVETKKSYLTSAYYEFNSDSGKFIPQITQLEKGKFETVKITEEGDGEYFYVLSDSGKRVEQQWQGFTKKDVFVINSSDGSNKQIMTNVRANIYPSYTGKYLLVYDEDKKQYSCYDADSNKIKSIAKDIPYPLYDEENDVPDAPNAYGIVKWVQGKFVCTKDSFKISPFDIYVLIYDKYDIWKVDPTGKEKSVCITNGRKDKIQYRYVTVDNDEKFISDTSHLLLRAFDEIKKITDYWTFEPLNTPSIMFGGMTHTMSYQTGNINFYAKAKKADKYLYCFENFQTSPILTCGSTFLFETNLKQNQYLWGTAELFKWKAYTGKLTEGVLYKPENFDSTKKYPMIVYFYERNNATLHQYIPPAPTPSRLNIPYFVSNGYVVFVPDIWYTTGHPGKSACDYIVSGTRALIKKGFIDSTRIGLQGQSWGGYQTAYLITQTNLYKAAWAGAPVGNMFSAYGGIRWESGVNRQFQYEHSQSRIGATIWEKPNLYIENSPLFHLPKVKTPLVIMANDADGAVPWYQGIELFTAMRRLGKPVWMLNYNGEAHNLIERKNRKDIQIKEQQYFDWLLKDAPTPKWINEGVPAVMKGRVNP